MTTLAQYQDAVEVAMRDRRRLRKGRPSPTMKAARHIWVIAIAAATPS
jgi:hypothetical protein